MTTTETLKQASLDDVPAIMAMGEKLYKDSVYQNMKLDLVRARQMLEKFIIEGAEDYMVVLSHDNGKPVGVIAAYVFTPLFSSDKVATEVLLWLEPEYRTTQRGKELMDAYEYWAKLVGAKLVQYGLLSTADPRLGLFYKRRGAFEAENVYYKEIQ